MTFIRDPSDGGSGDAETLTRREPFGERCRCGAEAFAGRPRRPPRPWQQDAPVLDPERQRAIRAAIETEFP